eukprot:956-Prorocentrum_lima.AAC.1
MTSSLVGSEMCIRDRSKTWPASLGTRPRSLIPKPSDIPWLSPHWSSASPVSYTHLTLPTICSV